MKICITTFSLSLIFLFSGTADAQIKPTHYESTPEFYSDTGEKHHFLSNLEPISNNTKKFHNSIYAEVWGYAWVSLNYKRLFPNHNIALGGGFGPNPYARNFTLGGDGGMVINAYLLKQFPVTGTFQLGIGAGSSYDFDGRYHDFWDPIYIKATLNRYSRSIAEDRLYYGFNLYYIQWDNRNIRPSAKLGFSF